MELELYPPLKKIDFPSIPNNIRLVEKLIDDICENLDIKENKYGNILIAITEAVNNAIIHGNKKDSNKTTSITCSHKDNEILFSISDEGSGFDFNNVPDPTDPKNIEKNKGRGIFLMSHLSDKISFANNGTRVELSFSLS